MEQVVVIDTNVISRYFNNSLDSNLVSILETSSFKISVITRIELLSWDKYNSKQLEVLTDFVSNCNIVYLDDNIVVKTIELRRKYKLKIPDAIIAASALLSNATLISLDNDFKNVKGLKVVGL